MAFGRQQAFLDAASPTADDEPAGLAAGLQLILDLLKDPKKADALTRRALDAARAIEAARRTADDLEALQRRADANVAAAKARIDRELTAHETAIAVAAKEIALLKKQASDLKAQAEADAKSAAADKAEQRKRLQAVERAVSGSV